MLRFFIFFFFAPLSLLIAQELSVSGKIIDSHGKDLSFVNVMIYSQDSEVPLKGNTTTSEGIFKIGDLLPGSYDLEINHIGFSPIKMSFELLEDNYLGKIEMSEELQTLDEAHLKIKIPTLKVDSGNLIFNVENTSFSTGNTLDLLKKTPGILIFENQIKVKSSTPVIYINNRKVYLSSSEVSALLLNLDAANIKSIEVITEPSAKYDADADSVINIITSKHISIGYKGSIHGSFTQSVYAKYNLGTSHFYKNNWIDVYASYSYSDLKAYKEDDSHLRFFAADQETTSSIWDTYFNRTTRNFSHTLTSNFDFTLDEKNSLEVSSHFLFSPHMQYDNYAGGEIKNSLGQLDSLYASRGNVDHDTNKFTLNLAYKRILDDSGSLFTLATNYIDYNSDQVQFLRSDYYLANGDILGINSFSMDSHQKTKILTGQGDLSIPLWNGTLDSGLELSATKTNSKLDFFDLVGNTIDNQMYDDFYYQEWIFGGYFDYKKRWEKWNLTLGIRAEQTEITTQNHSLDQANDQSYFDIFPSVLLHRKVNLNNGIGISYKRSLNRPQFESLNPFKYYITDNNYFSGNPDLKPAIKDRISLNFDHKNKLFFSLYYEKTADYLDMLSFQDNENFTLRTLNANLIHASQFSIDVQYYTSFTDWWWFYISTSSFYYANEFYALESLEEKYTNDTFGQYVQSINNFKISEDGTWTSDLVVMYLSNFVTGSQYFKNQSFVNISFRKSLWSNRASISLAVNDIFNTSDVRVFTRYYNQDNNYFANSETRNITLGFKYDFGNASLRDNQREISTEENTRLKK